MSPFSTKKYEISRTLFNSFSVLLPLLHYTKNVKNIHLMSFAGIETHDHSNTSLVPWPLDHNSHPKWWLLHPLIQHTQSWATGLGLELYVPNSRAKKESDATVTKYLSHQSRAEVVVHWPVTFKSSKLSSNPADVSNISVCL